jgi:hypothetical protein
LQEVAAHASLTTHTPKNNLKKHKGKKRSPCCKTTAPTGNNFPNIPADWNFFPSGTIITVPDPANPPHNKGFLF